MSEKIIPTQDPANFVSAIRAALRSPEANEIKKLDPMTEARVNDQKTDTELKKLYAKWFIIILAAQLLAMDGIFIAVGLDLLKLQEPTHLNLFMGGTLAEVFGVVFVITRYLFSKRME